MVLCTIYMLRYSGGTGKGVPWSAQKGQGRFEEEVVPRLQLVE